MRPGIYQRIIAAYRESDGTSNWPTEALNGRVEHPGGSALDQLHCPITPRDRRIQPTATPSNTMSRLYNVREVVQEKSKVRLDFAFNVLCRLDEFLKVRILDS